MVIRVLYAYCQSYSYLHVGGYSDKGGGEGGNQSAYCTCTFRVTLTYVDSLTRGGG